MKTAFFTCFFLICCSACLTVESVADTVYFKSGRSIDGIVKAETPQGVEIEIGFGTIVCSRAQISRIERSTPEEIRSINAGWTEKRKELEARREEFDRERERRLEEYGNWVREVQERQHSKGGNGVISVRRDAASRSILVETLLNGKVKAVLVLDTGASVVVLTKRVGESLGLKLDSSDKRDMVELRLAGNHKVEAKMVTLKSVEIQGAQVKDVLAAVLTEDYAHPGFKDGLLGMTFLNRFNLKLDFKDMKMSLEKLN